MPKILEWLDENPISDPTDIAFLSNKLVEHKAIAKEAERVADYFLDKQWTGRYPYLRMIHALMDQDDAERLFLARYDLDNIRLQVKNQNSTTKRVQTVWEMVSDCWNDSDFCPITGVYLTCTLTSQLSWPSITHLFHACLKHRPKVRE